MPALTVNNIAIAITVMTLAMTIFSIWLTRRNKNRPRDEYSLTLQPAAWETEGGTDLTAPIVTPAPPPPDPKAQILAEAEAAIEATLSLEERQAVAVAPQPRRERPPAPPRPQRPDPVPRPTEVVEEEIEEPSSNEPLTAPFDLKTMAPPSGARLRPAGASEDSPPRLMDEVVKGLEKVPPLPQSLHLILKELEAAGSTARSVGDILSSDPIIGAALLRVVNSASTGLARRILTLHEAVSFLGFTAVRSVVLRLKLSNFLPHPKGKRQCYDTAALWLHSTAVSAVADVLAKRISHNPNLRIDPSLASTLGLLHDIGKLAINSQFPDKVGELWSKRNPADESLLARERRLFGADHAFMGAFLAARWKLPEELAEAIRLHHLPAGEMLEAVSPPMRRALVVVHIANQLVKYRNVYCEDMEIDVVTPELLAVLNLPPTLEELLDDQVIKAINQSTAIARELGVIPQRPQRLSA
jgi:putative nucleotidyltransferase with HDIG domain